jgi:hypothetical protein
MGLQLNLICLNFNFIDTHPLHLQHLHPIRLQANFLLLLTSQGAHSNIAYPARKMRENQFRERSALCHFIAQDAIALFRAEHEMILALVQRVR